MAVAELIQALQDEVKDDARVASLPVASFFDDGYHEIGRLRRRAAKYQPDDGPVTRGEFMELDFL